MVRPEIRLLGLNEERLTADIVELARRYGRCGYGRVTTLPRAAGWLVNDKRGGADLAVRRAEGPGQAADEGKLWLNDGSCVRLRPEHRDHLWA